MRILLEHGCEVIEIPRLEESYSVVSASREEYAELFAVIGTDFGAGDGETTFNVRDPEGGTRELHCKL